MFLVTKLIFPALQTPAKAPGGSDFLQEKIQYRVSDGSSGLPILLVRLCEKLKCALRSNNTDWMVFQELWTQFLFLCKNSMCSVSFLHSLEVVALLLTWAQLLDQSCSWWKGAGEVRPPICFFEQPGQPHGWQGSCLEWPESAESWGSRELWPLSLYVLSLCSHGAGPPHCLWSQMPAGDGAYREHPSGTGFPSQLFF